ncbi:hypothetical protein [Noviherbaspirillum massiliense]|uniref:hypothetical protein n=1 Tax=Noviherbaspirillum massiliense TaxID=1465823 RepID=UPI0009472527|nr:hypothetical protein [Noviherbaspirillum massiliense]
MKFAVKPLAVSLLVSSFLGGCAVYGPPPAYSQGPYYQAAPVYAQPAPVYVQPAPVYVEPPISFGLNFGFWGGGRHGWGGHRH